MVSCCDAEPVAGWVGVVDVADAATAVAMVSEADVGFCQYPVCTGLFVC